MATEPTNQSLTASLIDRLAKSSLQAIVKLELRDADGGTWYVRLGGATPELLDAIENGEHPDVIVTADRVSLDALLSGRMSFSDGIVSERVSLAGDVSKIVALKDAISGER
ncbi:MAG: SCP2 sterol-binding domain-containing protein [Myxococcota bacterium]